MAPSYEQVLQENQRALAQARLDDPAEHFPYKHDVVTRMLADGTPMGPGIPGQLDGAGDSQRTIDDYMSPGIADASNDYVAAQAEYLADPCEQTRAAYDAARDDLLAARLDHRANRTDAFVVGAASRRAG